ncbi:MAG TPA: MATE family efflux transporter [Terriglobales bacterium]|nr:MATE family efflux transporter [Terriglobales bacterium]
MQLTKKTMLKMMIPMLIDQLFFTFLPMVNTIVVSRLGQNSLSGVSIIDQVNMMVGYVVIAIAFGAMVVVAQCTGKGDTEGVYKAVKQSYTSSLYIAASLSAFMVLFAGPVVSLALRGADPDMQAIARTYLRVTALSYPLYCFYNNSASLLRGVGDTRRSMWMTIIMNSSQFMFSILFIYILELGTYGAGYATLSGRAVGAILGAILIRRRGLVASLKDIFGFKLDWELQKRFVRFGVPAGAQSFFFVLARLTMNVNILMAGTAHISANVVYTQLIDLQCAGSSMANMIAPTIMGMAKGMGDEEGIKRAYKDVLFFSFWFGLVFALMPYLYLTPLIGLYNLSPEAFQLARTTLMWNPVFIVPLVWFAATTPTAFRGVGDSLIPPIFTVSSLWIARVGTVVFLCTRYNLGIYAGFFGIAADYVMRNILYFWRYKSGAWLKASRKITV